MPVTLMIADDWPARMVTLAAVEADVRIAGIAVGFADLFDRGPIDVRLWMGTLDDDVETEVAVSVQSRSCASHAAFWPRFLPDVA